MTPLARLLVDCVGRRGVVVPASGDVEVAGNTALVDALWGGFREFAEMSVGGLYPGLFVPPGREELDTLVLETSQAVSGARIPIMNRPAYASLARRLYLVDDENREWRENQEMTIAFLFSAESPTGLFDDRESTYALGGPQGQTDEWAGAVEASRFGSFLRDARLIESAQFRATG